MTSTNFVGGTLLGVRTYVIDDVPGGTNFVGGDEVGAPSSLATDRNELYRKLGRYTGYGDPSVWNASQLSDIDDAIRDGLRRFYFPEDGHAWSFMTREHSVSLYSGEAWYPLPDGFFRMIGRATVVGQKRPLAFVSEHEIRSYQEEEVSSTYRFCSIRSSVANTLGGTGYDFGIFPTPTGVGTVQLYYLFDPGQLYDTSLNPVGGAIHADTILYACLAAFDELFNSESVDGQQTESAKNREFMSRLKTSIAHDQQFGVK